MDESEILFKISVVLAGIILILSIIHEYMEKLIKEAEFYNKVLRRMSDYQYLMKKNFQKKNMIWYKIYKRRYKRLKEYFIRITKGKYYD